MIKTLKYTVTSNSGGAIPLTSIYPELSADKILILNVYNTNTSEVDACFVPYIYGRGNAWYIRPINSSSRNELISPPKNGQSYDLVVRYIDL